jgi:hypothetical protein
VSGAPLIQIATAEMSRDAQPAALAWEESAGLIESSAIIRTSWAMVRREAFHLTSIRRQLVHLDVRCRFLLYVRLDNILYLYVPIGTLHPLHAWRYARGGMDGCKARHDQISPILRLCAFNGLSNGVDRRRGPSLSSLAGLLF